MMAPDASKRRSLVAAKYPSSPTLHVHVLPPERGEGSPDAPGSDEPDAHDVGGGGCG
jgi:hypothetical protein